MSQAPAPDDDVKREYEVGRSMNFQMVIRGVGDVGLAPSELPSESGTLFFFSFVRTFCAYFCYRREIKNKKNERIRREKKVCVFSSSKNTFYDPSRIYNSYR